MFEWFAAKAVSIFASTGLKLFGDSILQPVLNAWAKSKDINLATHQADIGSSVDLIKTIITANVENAKTQTAYAEAILSWWPFRVLLFMLLVGPVLHMFSICVDATLPKMLGYASWDIDPIKGAYAGYEKELLEFFIIAKPVDTAVSGLIGLFRQIVAKK